jgi:histidinol phosphatase-like PHP family hydrolase
MPTGTRCSAPPPGPAPPWRSTPSPGRLDLNDELVRRARYAGVRFAISIDAHADPHLDYMRFGVATAQGGWAGQAEVINTWPLTRLRRFLAKHPPARTRAS